MLFAICEEEKIVGYREIPEEDTEIIKHYRETETLIPCCEDHQADTHYVKDGKITTRPTMPLSIMDNRIFNVPVGAKLRIAEQTFEINDTVAEISGYHGPVKITCWPYLDEDVEI